METRDRRHALEVAGRITAEGIDDRDLLAAALLHDCGKGAVPVWLRIAKVLSPRLVALSAVASSAGWRGAAYRLIHHSEIGARKAEAAGVSPAVVRLIAGTVRPEEAHRLALLQAADDAS